MCCIFNKRAIVVGKSCMALVASDRHVCITRTTTKGITQLITSVQPLYNLCTTSAIYKTFHYVSKYPNRKLFTKEINTANHMCVNLQKHLFRETFTISMTTHSVNLLKWSPTNKLLP